MSASTELGIAESQGPGTGQNISILISDIYQDIPGIYADIIGIIDITQHHHH